MTKNLIIPEQICILKYDGEIRELNERIYGLSRRVITLAPMLDTPEKFEIAKEEIMHNMAFIEALHREVKAVKDQKQKSLKAFEDDVL